MTVAKGIGGIPFEYLTFLEPLTQYYYPVNKGPDYREGIMVLHWYSCLQLRNLRAIGISASSRR